MELCSTKFFNHEEKSKDNHLRLCVANDDNELQLKHSRLSGRAGARSTEVVYDREYSFSGGTKK